MNQRALAYSEFFLLVVWNSSFNCNLGTKMMCEEERSYFSSELGLSQFM